MINIQDFLKQKGYKDVPDILPESTKLPSQIDIQSFLREKGYEKFGVPTPTITPKTGPVDVESFLKEKKLGEPQPLALVEGKPKEEERVGLFESIKNFITSKPIRAVRNNNPGNLKSGSMLHDALASKNPDGSIKTDDQGHLVFPNKQVGWLASYADLDAKMAGLTRNELLADKAGVDVSIADLNQAYATDTNWKYSVAKIYNKLTGEKITTNTDVSTLDRDALQLAVLTQEGFILPKIDYALYSRLKERGVTDIEHFPMAKPQEQREFYEGKIPEPSGLKPTEVKIERPEPITDPTKIGGFLQFLGRSPKEQLKMLTQTPEIKIDKALEKQLKDKGIKNPLDFIEYSPENKRRILADEIEPKTLSKITVDDIEGIDTIKIFAENRVKELAEMSFKFPERRADYIKMASQWRQVLKMDDLKDKNGFQDFITGIISDFKEDKTEKMVLFMRSLLPYLRLESDKIKQISKKIEKNESLTTAEQNYIDKYMLEQTAETKRASHFWFNIGKNIIEMPAWIGEMAAMLYATRGVRTNIGTAMQGMTGKRLLSAIGSRVVQAGAMTSLNLPAILQGQEEFQVPDMNFLKEPDSKELIIAIEKSGDDFYKALARSYGINYVETLSEMSGELLPMGKINKFFKATVLEKWLKIGFKKGTFKTIADATSYAAKVGGWNGIVPEMFEEQLGEPFRALIMGEKYNAPLITPEGTQRLLQELATIGLFGTFISAPKLGSVKFKQYKAKKTVELVDKFMREDLKIEEVKEKITEDKIFNYAKERKIELLAKPNKEMTTLERIELSNLKKKIKDGVVKDRTWIKNFYKDKIVKPVEKKPSEIIKEKVVEKRIIKKAKIKPKEIVPKEVKPEAISKELEPLAKIKSRAIKNSEQFEDKEFTKYVADTYDEFMRDKKGFLKQAQEIEPKILDVELSGSYGKGIPTPESDIDFKFIYRGKINEDILRNNLEGKFGIGGGGVDIHLTQAVKEVSARERAGLPPKEFITRREKQMLPKGKYVPEWQKAVKEVKPVKKVIPKKVVPKKKTALDKAKEKYELAQKKKKIEKRVVKKEQVKRIAERKKKMLAEIKEKKPKEISIKKKVTEKEQQVEADKRVDDAIKELENEQVKKDLELYQKKVKAKKMVDYEIGARALESYIKRLGISFDITLANVIFTGKSFFGIKSKAFGVTTPATGDIALAKQISRFTPHHEIVHLVWVKENFNKIKAFKHLDRNAILNDITSGKKMTDRQVHELLATKYEKFVKDQENNNRAYYNVKGKYLRRFFSALWNGLKKIFKLGKNLNEVQKFYDTLYYSKIRTKELVSMKAKGEVEEFFQEVPFEDTTREKQKKADLITEKQRKKIGVLRSKDETKYKEAKKKIGITTSKGISKFTASKLIDALLGKVTKFVKKSKYDSDIKEIMIAGKGWKNVKSITALNQAKELKEQQKKKAFVKTHQFLSSIVNMHLTAYQILRDISIKIGDKAGTLVDKFIDSHDKVFDKYKKLKENTEAELKDIAKKYKTSLGKIATTTGFKGKQEGWKSLTMAERIQILLAKYDKGKRLAILRKKDKGHNDGILLKSTGDEAHKMSLDLMKEIWEKALPVEKEIAKWWVGKSKEYLELINLVLKRLGYEQIDGEEGYSALFREYAEKKPLASMDELIRDMFGEPPMVGKKGVPKKWSIERKDITTGRAVIGNAVSDILRDIDRKAYFIEASEQIRKNISIIHDKYFKENFIENFGLAKWNELSHWSKGLISPFKQNSNETSERIVKKMSRNVSLSFVLARATTAVLQAASFTHGVGFLGYESVPYFLKTFGDMIKHPKQVINFVYEVYPQVKNRFFMPLMSELQNIHDNTKFGNIKNNILKSGTFLAKMFDKVVIPLVYTAYNMELTKTGSVDKAYAKGMALLRETQPMGTLKDMPRILGGGNERAVYFYVMGRLRTYVTKRTTYTFSRLFRPDRIYRVQTGTTAQRLAKTTATVMWDNFWSLAVTSFLVFLIKHRRPPEKWKDILECLSYPLLGIFVLGHILGMLTYGITNFTTIPGQIVNRIVWAINSSIKAVKNKDEEQALKALKHSTILALMYNGLPSTQPELFQTYLLDKIKGDDPSLWRLLYRQNVLEEKGKEAKSSGLFKLMKSDFGGGFKGKFKDSF